MLEERAKMTPVMQEECEKKVSSSSTSSEHKTEDEPSSSPVNFESVIVVSCQEREASTSEKDGISRQRNDDDIKLYQVQPRTPDCIIDVTNGNQTLRENHIPEKICRICHLTSEDISESSVLIKLGCSCKGDLGTSHRHCAEIWFKHRASRICEICGKTAMNVKTITNTRRTEARALAVHQYRSQTTGNTTNLPETESSCGCRNSFCNILLMCILLAFVLPWFYHIVL